VVTDLAGPGTAEDRWRAWPPLGARSPWPALDPAGLADVVVIAPHPDDEVLGVGDLLALAAAAGARVRLVAVTDGERSHPRSSAITPAQLRRERPREAARALAGWDCRTSRSAGCGSPTAGSPWQRAGWPTGSPRSSGRG
jgi:hypothetical protein